MKSPMTSKRGRGWDGLSTPVPGNVMTALEELGVPVVREVGEELVALCPMHEARTGKPDNHPSWSVNVDSGIHHCFACGYKGQFVGLVADLQGWTWTESVSWVRVRGGVERARKRLHPVIEPAVKLDTTKQINEASLALMGLPPKKEMKRRHLTFDAVQHHGVLWDPNKRCWILPIRDPNNHKLWGWQEKSEKFFRNRPREVTKSKTLFGLDVFQGDSAILVESPLDVVRLTSTGITGGLATFGASVSHEQMALVRNIVDVVIIGMDNDPAGKKSTAELRKEWGRKGLTLRYLNYGDSAAKDIGDMSDEEIHQAVVTSYSFVRIHADRSATPLPRRSRR